jgi:aspartyl-tRNA(Asn)/glutamyl-tRNA(Gln) amidotransferase subunit A
MGRAAATLGVRLGEGDRVMGVDWVSQTAGELGRGIARGDIAPRALLDAFLDAIDAHPFADRIYARMTSDRARAEADAAQDRADRGMRLSPLDGVPISWKDLFDTAGVGTEAGTALLAGRTPDADARVLANATAAGLVCLGKTHMTELAFSGLGLNPVTASPPCVNDHAAVSGGSSSGAGTSVAFGLAAAGIGSDTGGSVRIPAAWNDLVGLKTTSARLSLDGVVPLAARFDTVGPLCRSVEDAHLLLAAMEGKPASELGAVDLAGATFLVLETVAFDDIHDAPRAGFESAIERLGAAGAKIERGQIAVVNEAMALSGVLFASEAYGTWRDAIEANPDVMFANVRERFRAGKAFSAPDYVAAWQALDRYRAAWAEATRGYDAVLLPTSPILPPNLERLSSDSDFFVAENLLALRNTRIGNLMGLCALTLPTGVPSAGLMMMGAPMQEEALLALGRAAEAALA